MFQLVTFAGGTPVPVLAADGKPFVFETGREAAEAAHKLTMERGAKVQPRPMADNGWQERERLRFEDGTYQRVPFEKAEWFQGSVPWSTHFLHVSTERADMVAFTEDAAKGAADRQTRLKVGVYLTRYFGDVLSSDAIRDIATAFTAEREEHTVMFAATADEIERVYTQGPESCMSKPAGCYDSSIHPVRVYAAGDLQVAYIERGGSITARALVWPAKKAVGRVYGDEARLLRLLRQAGYDQDYEAFEGARMLRIEERGTYVAPYLDGDLWASDHGDFLRLSYEDGEMACGRTDGFATEPDEEGEYCEHCEEYRDPDGFETVWRLNLFGRRVSLHMCECCVENDTFVCDATGDRWRDDHAVPMANGDTWSQAHFEDHGFSCPDCGGNFPVEDGTLGEDGEMRCSDCHEEWQERNREDDEGEEADEADDALSPAPQPERSGWDALQAEADTRQPDEFRVGDRVLIQDLDATGTVRFVDPDGVGLHGIEMDAPSPGHSLGGRIATARGWWAGPRDLTRILPTTASSS